VRLLSERTTADRPVLTELPLPPLPTNSPTEIPITEGISSKPSSRDFLEQMTAMLMAIAAVVAARILLLLALVGSFALAYQAMTQSTLTNLIVTVTFNVTVVLPLVWLAWQKG
jgi:hypothetical protein